MSVPECLLILECVKDVRSHLRVPTTNKMCGDADELKLIIFLRPWIVFLFNELKLPTNTFLMFF